MSSVQSIFVRNRPHADTRWDVENKAPAFVFRQMAFISCRALHLVDCTLPFLPSSYTPKPSSSHLVNHTPSKTPSPCRREQAPAQARSRPLKRPSRNLSEARNLSTNGPQRATLFPLRLRKCGSSRSPVAQRRRVPWALRARVSLRPSSGGSSVLLRPVSPDHFWAGAIRLVLRADWVYKNRRDHARRRRAAGQEVTGKSALFCRTAAAGWPLPFSWRPCPRKRSNVGDGNRRPGRQRHNAHRAASETAAPDPRRRLRDPLRRHQAPRLELGPDALPRRRRRRSPWGFPRPPPPGPHGAETDGVRELDVVPRAGADVGGRLRGAEGAARVRRPRQGAGAARVRARDVRCG